MMRPLTALPLLLAFLAVAGFLPLAPAGSPHHAPPLPFAPSPMPSPSEAGAFPTHAPSPGPAPSLVLRSPSPSRPVVPPSTSSSDPSSVAAEELSAAQASLDRGMGPAASSPASFAQTSPPPAPMSGHESSRPSSPLAVQTAGSGDSWSELSTPLPWHDVSMAYDAADGYVVEFGGTPYGSTGPFSGTTWEFASGAWTQLTPTISPGERSGAAMAYDPADGVVLLFGGTNDWGVLGDTWEFKGGQWSEASSTSSPPARHWASMAFDAADGYVLLFGGQSSNGYLFDDTWTFKGGAWSELTPPSAPSGRFGSSLAFDAADGYALLFSGDSTHLLSDTWEYLGGTWTNVTAQLPTAPPGRIWGASTWDSTDGYVLLYAGNDGSPMTDAWKYVAGAWTSLGTTSISARYGEGLTYDPAEGAPLLFGGSGTATPPYEAWTTFVWRGGAWGALAPAQDPAARNSEGLAYDVADGYVVLFGGITSGGVVLGDTWTYAGGTWTELESAQATAGQCTLLKTGATVGCPDPRAAASMVYDLFDQYVLLYGGWNAGIGNSFLGDTWEFTAGAWHELSTYNSGSSCTLVQSGGLVECPPERYAAGMANYRVQGGPIIPSVILFGGNTPSSGFVSDTWQYANGWQQLTPTTSPSSREDPSMATDLSAGGEVLLFGGYGGSEMGDTWEFTGSTWSQQTPSSAPSARDSAGMADGLPVLLFGGVAASGGNLGDSWSFRNGQWSQLPFATTPGPRGAPGLVNDTGAGYDLLYGGGADQDTWTFGRALEAIGPALSRPQVELGQSENFVAAGSEGGMGSYSYSWGGLPPGCTPSGTSASLSCTPTAVGTYSTNVVVDDSDGSPPATGGAVIFSVYPVPSTTSPAASPWSIDLGQTTTFSTTTTGGTGVYTWTWSGLPAGCAASNASAISCSPTATGSSSISVQVKDTHGFTATSGTLAFTILGDPSVGAPSASQYSVDVNQPVTYGAAPTGGASNYYRYSWAGLPSSCSSVNTSSLSCTPTTAGTFPIWVTVIDTNGYQVVSPTLSFVVHSNPSISLALNRTNLDLGESLTLWGNATGGSGTFSIWYQGLPCPTANTSTLVCYPSTAGTFTVTAYVNDTLGGSSFSPQKSFTVALDPIVVPWFARGSSVAYANQSLLLQLNYSQGTPFYRPCIDAPGSILVGVVCGAPQGGPNYQFGLKYTQPGTYSITASVEDSTGWNTTVTLTETVYWPLAPASISLPAVLDFGMNSNASTQLVHGIPSFSFWWNDTTGGGVACSSTASGDGPLVCPILASWLGLHTIEATIRDAGGMAWYANGTVLVNPALARLYVNASVGSFSVTTWGTLPDEVTATTSFAASFRGGTAPYTTTWDYNGTVGSMGGGTALSYSWSHAANYTVNFWVVDAVGQSTAASVYLRVSPTASNLVLSPHFSMVDAGVPDNLTLNFTGGLAPFSYLWYFGDGSNATTATNWVAKAWVGGTAVYTVIVYLQDATGVQLRTITQPTVVADPSILNITARAGPSTVGEGQTLTAFAGLNFELDGTLSGGQGPYNMSWWSHWGQTWGQWIQRTGPGPWLNFTLGLSIQNLFAAFWFNVTDVEGVTASGVVYVRVLMDNLSSPVLSSSPPVVDVGAPDNIAVAISGGNGTLTYDWNIGNSSYPVTSVPWYLFTPTAAGRTWVGVEVWDAYGQMRSGGTEVRAVPGLSVPCAPTANTTSLWAGDPFTLNLTCVKNGTSPYAYLWEFDDGHYAGGSSFSRAFPTTGSHWVHVLVNDSGGGSAISLALGLPVLGLADFSPVITNGFIDSVTSVKALSGGEYSVALVLEFYANGMYGGTGFARACSDLATQACLTSETWGPVRSSASGDPLGGPIYGFLTLVVQVTRGNPVASIYLQAENSLNRTSAPFLFQPDLSAYLPAPTGGGALPLGEVFLAGVLIVVAVFSAVLWLVMLSRKRKTRGRTGGSPCSSSTSDPNDITSEAMAHLKAYPNETKDGLVSAVAEAKKMPREDVETQLVVLVSSGKVVASGVNGRTTYRLPNGSNGAASEEAAAELDRQKAETEQALGLRRKEALDRLDAAIPEGAGYVPERMVREAVADLGMSDGEFWGYVGELKELNHWKVKGRKKEGFWFHRMVENENAVPEPPRPRISFTLKDAQKDPPGPLPPPGPSLMDERPPEE
ncbi:MAG: hypothetical protein KGJ23_11265 [Euryarchaeota archaeon]|nr:hypothetical protein [Euryarchaeota archaeon]MDE1837173.1 hypothetical protein [Euryarchaeota archaeon]MDE1881097.1 hypothetical protein [Euryarchaeota archaeon]MDE2045329.1 hypothetical protein [Thermoplasmata archaeon]